jgi:hypothetical protein
MLINNNSKPITDKQEMTNHLNNPKNWRSVPAFKNLKFEKPTFFQKLKAYISSLFLY